MKIILTTDTHYDGSSKQTRRNHELYIEEMAIAIKENNCQVVIHTGDWISHRQDQLEKTFELFRTKIDIPILGVFGNHDYWNEKYKGHGKFRGMSWNKLLEYHDEILLKYNITHLTKNPTVIDNYVFMGFDGWYNMENPNTNDLNFMPLGIEGHTHKFMAKKGYNEFCDILDAIKEHSDKKKVLLTHFPPINNINIDSDHAGNPKYLPEIKENFNILCYGHTHDEVDYVEDKLRILNSGAKYGKPSFLVKEI